MYAGQSTEFYSPLHGELPVKTRFLGAVALTVALAAPVQAQGYFATTTQIGGAVLANFEGFAEGTLIQNQYAGVTFGQAPSAGRPQIDNSPYLYGYTGVGGSSVLTGSMEGGYPYPTVAGITATFSTGKSQVEAWFSDTAPLGSYLFSIFGVNDVLLATFGLTDTQISAAGGGGYVGFTRATSDIYRIQFGPSTVSNDAFAIDDLRAVSTVPEPSTVALMGAGGVLMMLFRRRRSV